MGEQTLLWELLFHKMDNMILRYWIPMPKIFIQGLFLMCILYTSGFAVENSIISELDAEKCMAQHKNKFSERQYQELAAALDAPCQFRLMSYNILSKYYDGLQKIENTWENRKERVLELIAHDSPDILCCQELTPDQIFDLMLALNQEYEVYAPLPNETKFPNSELLGIFYKKQRFVLKQAEKKELGIMYYWEEFNNYCFQYFIKAKFIDKESGKEFIVYTTHADYLIPNVRLKLVDFLLEDAEKDALLYPTIIAGDFNTLPGMLPDIYKAPSTPGFDGTYLLQMLTKKNFRNSLELTLIAHAGPLSSFTYPLNARESFSGLDPFGLLIDHIFVTPNTIKVIFHAVEPATVNGKFPSDHVPVLVDLAIP